MRQRKQRRYSDHSNETKDRWLITYADLITLLLIFFVIMYAMSRLDIDKYETVTQSLQLTFNNGNSLLEKGSGVTGTNDSQKYRNPSINDTPEIENNNNTPPSEPSNTVLTERELEFRKQEEQLHNLMKVIELYVQDNQLQDQIYIADTPKGISITLSDRFLFDAGDADLKNNATEALSKLASLFKQLDTMISIEGHTDSQPIVYASKYKDNWELSGARALSVLRYFIDIEHIDPDGFQYAGYGDTQPTADNGTIAGRQKNRRVEITVLRQLQQ